MTAEDIEMIQTAETIVCKGNGRVFVSVDKMLEIIETAHFDLDDSALERDVYMRVSEFRKWMKKAVKELTGERTV